MRISDWSSDVCSSDLFMDGEDRYGTSRDTAPFASSPAYLLHRLVADEPDVGDAQALGAGEHFGDVLVFDQLVRPDVKLGLLGGVGRLQQDRKSTRLNSSH